MKQQNNDIKERGQDKLAKIPVKIINDKPALKKPPWLKIRASHNPNVENLKQKLRQNGLVSVCEEASCPNLNECFSHGTATFMIMGDRCTRRCSFCDVAHGRPLPLDPLEPFKLAKTIFDMKLKYVVVTSVDRDDLLDGGASHFAECTKMIRNHCPDTKVEWLVPDFRGRWNKALDILCQYPPDVFNHNLETTERLYKIARPGSNYAWSLKILKEFKMRFPSIPTKSGIMVGLGETDEEVIQCLKDMRKHNIDMATIGQYLSPSAYHLPVNRYVSPEQFKIWKNLTSELGFTTIASGPLVRSSYHADVQAMECLNDVH